MLDLWWACKDNDLAEVERLLAEGYNVDGEDTRRIPLIGAAMWGFANIIERLLAHNANLNLAHGEDKLTAIHRLRFWIM